VGAGDEGRLAVEESVEAGMGVPTGGTNVQVIMYMAITANGFIAKQNDDTSWVTSVEWDSFRSMIKRTGNMIIGRRTYGIMREGDEFVGLEGIKAVVVTSKATKSDNTNITFATDPKQALEILQEQKFKQALVCGGGTLNGVFMKAKLVDEIYLDIEPTLFGKGNPLFGNADFEAKLELLDIKKLSDSEIQVHYKVKRKEHA